MRLHVNVDHVATVRQARRTDEPDPVHAAVLAELGGADGITVHLREDRRHIQDRDVRVLMDTVRTGVNFECAVSGDVLAIALELAPMTVTLVPERREEITTEGGLGLKERAARARVGEAVTRLNDAGIRSSLFIDPDADAIRAAADLGCRAVELHTGEFAEAWKAAPAPHSNERVAAEVKRLVSAAALARELRLAVHAGHGLTYQNVVRVAMIPDVEELNIGHSIVSRAVLVGMQLAVHEMKRVVMQARGVPGHPGE